MHATSRASRSRCRTSSVRARAASRRRQRGAIGLFGVLTLGLAVLFTALVVDAGRLWFQTRQLQTVVDLAAIEAGQRVGCAADLDALIDAAQASAERNGFGGDLGSAPNVVEVGGTATDAAGVRSFVAGEGATAVRVVATRTVVASLVAGGWLGRQTTLRAEAVAAADPPLAAFWLGSTVLGVAEQGLLNSLLGAVLGSPVTLDLVSYQGLASARVTLGDLQRLRADAGTVDELLSTELTLAETLDLVADALDGSQSASVQAAAAGHALANATVRDLSLRLEDLLVVAAPAREAAATAEINVLQLVSGAALLANGEQAIALNLGVNVPGILSIGAQLQIVEPPQIAVGPPGSIDGTACTIARTAQVRVAVPVQANVLGLASIDLGLRAEVAQAQAGLADIRRQSTRTDVLIDARPGIAEISLGNAAGTGPGRITALLGAVPVAELGLELSIDPGSDRRLEFAVAHPVADNLPQAQRVSSAVGDSLEHALRSATLDIDVLPVGGLLGVLLGNVLNTIVTPVLNQVVAPLLGEIGRVLLDPLLKLLGVDIGAATVQLDSLQLRGARQLLL